MLENSTSSKKVRALIETLDGDDTPVETQLARAVDVMIARAKRIYILIIKINKYFFFPFARRCVF